MWPRAIHNTGNKDQGWLIPGITSSLRNDVIHSALRRGSNCAVKASAASRASTLWITNTKEPHRLPEYHKKVLKHVVTNAISHSVRQTHKASLWVLKMMFLCFTVVCIYFTQGSGVVLLKVTSSSSLSFKLICCSYFIYFLVVSVFTPLFALSFWFDFLFPFYSL